MERYRYPIRRWESQVNDDYAFENMGVYKEVTVNVQQKYLSGKCRMENIMGE